MDRFSWINEMCQSALEATSLREIGEFYGLFATVIVPYVRSMTDAEVLDGYRTILGRVFLQHAVPEDLKREIIRRSSPPLGVEEFSRAVATLADDLWKVMQGYASNDVVNLCMSYVVAGGPLTYQSFHEAIIRPYLSLGMIIRPKAVRKLWSLVMTHSELLKRFASGEVVHTPEMAGVFNDFYQAVTPLNVRSWLTTTTVEEERMFMTVFGKHTYGYCR